MWWVIGTMTLAGAAVLAVWRSRARWLAVTVEGPSMSPTLLPGDRVLVRRPAPAVAAVGTVVLVRRPGPCFHDAAGVPERPDAYLVKRVVAGPGDVTPDLGADSVLVAGTIVPAGALVLVGDNRQDSLDSRMWGYLPADRVIGVVSRRVSRRDGAAGRVPRPPGRSWHHPFRRRRGTPPSPPGR
ncbi:S26 family signal peptidase [Micromonospora sp. GCM10011542]|uniref:S26 family signal peptidase n=1 Tax=Micromonospora sp. GCM10011542 TaxID=3317337 RepID=UPI0036093CB0